MAVVPRHHTIIITISTSLILLFHSTLPQIDPSSRALLNFKNSLTNSDSLTNWKISSDADASNSPCDHNNVWVGVVCNMDMVSSINLASMGLEGQPDVTALSPLERLEALGIQNNSLAGPIPAFSLLPTLKSIYASKNQFSGVIPRDYFHTLGSLKRLWLSDNKFSGPIPESLGELAYLTELHLQNNGFSGPIPDFCNNIDALNIVDLSNNKLQGPIPRQMNKFDKESFDNNPDLCGLKASKDCPITDPQSVLGKKLIIAAVVVVLLLIVISIKDKKKDQKLRIICNENMEEAVVTIPNNHIMTKKMSGLSRKSSYAHLKSKSKMRTSSYSAGEAVAVAGEVVMMNEEKGVFGSQDLMKATAEVLGNGGLGCAYKATLGNGLSVVLKKMKEMNYEMMSKDVFDGEMRKLGSLKHPNLLTPLAYHFRKEDKFLVFEYVPKGSLHNVLHGDRGIKHSELNWPNRLKLIKGVARALGYLHSELASCDLPHGNLKSCNVLIGQDYEPLISDYALHPLINSTPTAQSMFAYKAPEAIVSHKSDVYCLGIVVLEVVTGKYPCQYNKPQGGESGTDVVQWVRSAIGENRESELMDPGLMVEAKERVEGEIVKLLRIGAACTESEVDRRMDMKEALTRIEDV